MTVTNPVYRSSEFIDLKQKTKAYVDVSLAFKPSPVTNDITLLRDEIAINNSIKNIIMFLPSEVPFLPDIGSTTQRYLFDIADEATAGLLSSEIERAILFCEPRVTFLNEDPDMGTDYVNGSEIDRSLYGEQLGVFVSIRPDQNVFQVTVKYRIVGEERVFRIQQILTPTR